MLRSWCVLLHTRLTLTAWRDARLRNLLEGSDAAAHAAQRERAHLLARCVSRVSRAVPGSRCLARSIAVVRLLRAERLPGRLVLGVRREAATARAHAWVQVDGAPLGEDPDALRGYEVLRDAPLAVSWER
jgi:hypothetical protein